MNLLLDLGHSRLKWALDREPWQTHALTWRGEDLVERLETDMLVEGPLRRVLLAASSGHPAGTAIARHVQGRYGLQLEWLQSPAALGGVRNAYHQPQRLGIDRFLGLLAAWDAGLAPCVVADAGTALTLDALAADGSHLGGAIVPGAAMMASALGTEVPVLAGLAEGRADDCARSTEDAIASGIVHALAGAVERFARRASAGLGDSARLVLCGGGARQLAEQLDLRALVLEDAVLRGMRVYARHVPQA